MVNPDETTVIEIPAKLHKQPVVVAKRKQSGKTYREEDDVYYQQHYAESYGVQKPIPSVSLKSRCDPCRPQTSTPRSNISSSQVPI